MDTYSIKNILVPVDLSETSLNALHTAVSIGLKHTSRIYILNVIEPYQNKKTEGTNAADSNMDVLTALVGGIEYPKDLKPQLIQMEGNVLESILQTSQKNQCDLIIAGSHGASGAREGFIGSNAYNVIKYSGCPVLTIPTKKKYTSFKKVLFPIRPVTGALTQYEIASHFMAHQATLEVLGLSYLNIKRETGVLDKIVNEISAQLEMNKIKANTTWGKGSNASDEILQFAQQINPDLIVLTSSLDAINKPYFVGPHAQKIVNCSTVPLLNISRAGQPAFY